MNLAALQQGKALKVLSQKFNYSGLGILTRAQFIDRIKIIGGFVKEIKRRNFQAEDKEDAILEKIYRDLPSNQNLPEVIAFNKRKTALEQGIYKTTYGAFESVNSSSYTEITKIEFDYFNSL